jgi:general secretion pathway protein G
MTLVELIVAFSIMLVLTTMAVPLARSKVKAERERDLVNALREMRDAIDKYHGDRGRYPDSLDELVRAHYLRALPVDPVTDRSDTWQSVAPVDDPAGGLYDIRSGAAGTAHDGSAYADW